MIELDLVQDAPPSLPTVLTSVGPAFAPEDLAARKVLALFGRAMPRDFADTFALCRTFDRDVLLSRAAEIDTGFDRLYFAEMLTQLDRISDELLPVDAGDASAVRAFFDEWRRDLASEANSRVDPDASGRDA